jgi:hypothetical protein
MGSEGDLFQEGISESVQRGRCRDRLVDIGRHSEFLEEEEEEEDDSLEQSHLPSPRPGSPTVLRINVPAIKTIPPPIENLPTPARLLSVPVNTMRCYKIPSQKKLELKEDIFQQHQARLVNCDSEDALASIRGVNPEYKLKNRSGIDIIRYHKTYQNSEKAPKWFYQSLESIKAPTDGSAGWVPLANAKTWKSDIHLSKTGEWQLIPSNSSSFQDSMSKTNSASLSSVGKAESSSSDCGCEHCDSPQSTESKSDGNSPILKQHVAIEVKNENTYAGKLTSEEREKALKELDEIVHAMDKINEFGTQKLAKSCDDQIDKSKSKMNEFLTSMLQVDLTPLKKFDEFISNKNININSSRNKYTSSSSSSDEGDLEYGSGRVAALAKHFNSLGKAGIIRSRGGRNSRSGRKEGLIKGEFKSEPDISHEYYDDEDEIAFPPPDNPGFSVHLTNGRIHPVGFSMDRLIDLGHGVIIQDVRRNYIPAKCTVVNLDDQITESSYQEHEKHHSSTQTSPTLEISELCANENLEGNSETQNECGLKVEQNISEKVQKDAKNVKGNIKHGRLDLNRKSISVDEIEMRKGSQGQCLHKHYSLIDLGKINKIFPNSKIIELPQKSERSPKINSSFCSSQRIQQTYLGTKGNRNIKRWMSADDSMQMSGWSEKLREKDTLDFGYSKDVLRRLYKGDAIKGRKMRRIKKLEFQRSFVVSPLSYRQMSAGDIDINDLYCINSESSGLAGSDESRKL